MLLIQASICFGSYKFSALKSCYVSVLRQDFAALRHHMLATFILLLTLLLKDLHNVHFSEHILHQWWQNCHVISLQNLLTTGKKSHFWRSLNARAQQIKGNKIRETIYILRTFSWYRSQIQQLWAAVRRNQNWPCNSNLYTTLLLQSSSKQIIRPNISFKLFLAFCLLIMHKCFECAQNCSCLAKLSQIFFLKSIMWSYQPHPPLLLPTCWKSRWLHSIRLPMTDFTKFCNVLISTEFIIFKKRKYLRCFEILQTFTSSIRYSPIFKHSTPRRKKLSPQTKYKQ